MMLDRSAVILHYRQHVNIGMARLFELMHCAMEVDSESNCVIDEVGNRYLDCAGYCVFLLGHRHPAVVAAVQEQLWRHPVSSRILINPQLAMAAKRLANIAPPGLDYVWFGNSGAEVVEAALKLARANGKRRWIAMEGGYHGKSLGALSVSGRAAYRAPFLPLLEHIDFVPFGNADALDLALAQTPGEAAVILEPLQSEAGVIIPPAGFLQAASRICRRHGAFLIVDEISTGLGRTGQWWRCQAEPMEMDVLLTGKALGGGVLPVSALIATAEAFGPFNRDPLLHTSTFAGNPLACAAVVAAIGTIQHEGMIAKAQSIGRQLLAETHELLVQTASPIICQVRGAGLLIGIEFREEHHAAEFMLEMMRHKVLVSHSLHAHKVVRLTPPATLTEHDIARIVTAIEASFAAVAARYSGAT